MTDVTVLGSGSAGNAIAIRHQGKVLLIDVGFSGREMKKRLEQAGICPADIAGVMITHEHADHVKGLRVFTNQHPHLQTYTNALTAERLRYLEKAPEQMMIFNNGTRFPVGPFQVEPFSVSHDAVDPVGYILHCGDRRIGIATDFGHPGRMVPFKLRDCEVIVLESNHDPDLLRRSGRPPRLQNRILGRRGHLSNQLAVELVPEIIGPKTLHLIMAHLSEDCNRPKLVEDGIRTCLGQLQRSDINLLIAAQHEISPAAVLG